MIITGEGKVVGSGPGELEPWSGSGLAGASWTDASTAQPDLFVPLRRAGGMGYVAKEDHVVETWLDGSFRVAHTVVSRPMGSTTGEVSVLWDASRYDADPIHQVGPAFAVDVEAADPAECGIAVNGDVSVNAVYAQNVPRFDPMSDAFDYLSGVYQVFTDTLVNDAFTGGLITQGRHWLTLRVTATHFAAYLNGTRLGVPVAIPAWAAGRDSWGVHIVSISRIAQDDPGAQLDTWCWRPWTGTL